MQSHYYHFKHTIFFFQFQSWLGLEHNFFLSVYWLDYFKLNLSPWDRVQRQWESFLLFRLIADYGLDGGVKV